MGSRPPNKPLPSAPSSPPMDPSLQRQKLARLAWIRVGLGAIAGSISGFLNLVTLQAGALNQNAYWGLWVGILIYIGSYYLAKYNLVRGINAKDRNKLFTQGIGSFVIMFLFTWILTSTYHACITFAACHL